MHASAQSRVDGKASRCLISVEIQMNALPLRRLRILVQHEDPLLCAGLLAALRQHAQFDVHPDGSEAPADDSSSVDVVIVDYRRGLLLADGAERAARGLFQARILVLTANDREGDVRRAVEAGIHGYLLAGGPLQELIDAVTAVAHGARHLSPGVAQRIAESLTRTSLTSREQDVLQRVVMGEPNKVIARQLQIEVGTVKSHMRAIMTKLGAASRTQAAGMAARLGLVDERSPERPVDAAPAAQGMPVWATLARTGEAAHA
jgi:DNA-binding NarL/FixJ family response regulator